MRIKTNLTTDELIQNMEVIRRIISSEIPVNNMEYYSKMTKTCDIMISMLEEKKNSENKKPNFFTEIVDIFKVRE